DFAGEIVFRGEVAVEPAVRQARALHDVGDADAVEAVLAEERPGNLEDLLAVRGCLFACHPHGSTPSDSGDSIHDERHKSIGDTTSAFQNCLRTAGPSGQATTRGRPPEGRPLRLILKRALRRYMERLKSVRATVDVATAARRDYDCDRPW